MQVMLISGLTSFVVTTMGFLLSLWIFPRLHLLDFPARYGLERKRLPYPTGVIAILVVLGLLVAREDQSIINTPLLSAIVLLGAISFIDDRWRVSPWIRIIIQGIVALIVFIGGARIYTITHPFGGFIKLDAWVIATPLGSLPVLSGIFTIGWLMFTMNAMNWTDGIRGQTSIIATAGFVLLGLLAHLRTQQPEIAVVAWVLAGASGAGIFFEFPPGKMLIGDTGSMFYGLMLGLLGIMSGGKVATVFLALGIPLFDAVFVTIERMTNGRSPLQGGRDHLHHLLLDRRWSERRIILIIGLIEIGRAHV